MTTATGAPADQGEHPLAHHPDLVLVGTGAVEPAVAQDDPLAPVDAGHGVLKVAEGVGARAPLGRQIEVQRVVLGLHRAANLGVRPAGEALGDDAADKGGHRLAGPHRPRTGRHQRAALSWTTDSCRAGCTALTASPTRAGTLEHATGDQRRQEHRTDMYADHETDLTE